MAHVRMGICALVLPVLLALAASSSAAVAEDNADEKKHGAEVVNTPEPQQAKPGEEEKTPPATAEGAGSDPTKLSGRLKQVLTKKETAPGAPPPAPPKPPDIALKGLIKAADKPASAILEVDGKRQYVVQNNSQVSVKGADGRLLTLKIAQVSADGVELEIVELKEKMSLR